MIVSRKTCGKKKITSLYFIPVFLVFFSVLLSDLFGAQMQLQPEEGAMFESDGGQKCLLC